MNDTKKSGVKLAKRKVSKREMKNWIAGYIFIAPVVIGLGVFYIFPFFQNFWFGFNDVNKFNVATFCGMNNYVNLFQDKELFAALGNTLKYVIITVPISMVLSVIVAGLLNTKIKGTSIYRTLYFLPAVTMPVAIAMVWKWIYNGEFGILNTLLEKIGIEGQNWLSNPKLALGMVMVVGIWSAVGYNMIILLAGMQGISKSYYEAAAIDGAGSIKQFVKITIPMLTPTLFFVMITSIISGFQVFDTIYMMIGKTSLAFATTQSLVMIFYRHAFDYGNKGYAAAISIFIFGIIMIVTVFQLIMQKKWVNYE
ncbi:MAG: sugar ABC transporter permease [Lachnospiraceae bacterium]